MKAIDLAFVPEIVELDLSDEEKLTKLKEDFKIAKADLKAANEGDIEEAVDVARANAKAIKLQIKKLQKDIAEKAKPTIDQAKIDAIKAKIAANPPTTTP